MLRHLKTTGIFISLFLILLNSVAFAQNAIGKFTFVQGRVDILRPPATRAVPVKIGDVVFVGDIVRAKSDSKAEITFSDGNIVRVAPGTRVEISEYMFDELKGKGILKLSRGKVQAIIHEKIAKRIKAFGEANRFEIHTPTAIAGVRGTNFVVSFLRNTTSVLVLEGVVQTINPKFPDIAVTVNAGYITTVPLDQPPQPARIATDAEKNMYKGDFSPGESGKKSESEETAISETTSGGQIEPGAGDTGTETPSPVGTLTETPTTPTDIPQPPPISETVGIDSTAPVITITGPLSLTNLKDAFFEVSADEIVTFTYLIDNTKVVTSPNTSGDTFTISKLDDGEHIITITATDQAGNSSTTSYTWTVDTKPPIILVTPTASSPEEGEKTTLNISLSSNEPVKNYIYSYKLTQNGEKVGEGTGSGSSLTISGVPEGNNYKLEVDVEATDFATNKSKTSFSIPTFDLNRYTLTGSVSGTGSTLTGSATGDVAGVLNKDWGGWRISISGNYNGSSGSSWKIASGGKGYDSPNNPNGYWLDIATGSYSGTTMNGISQLTYLNTETLGKGTGKVNGSYKGSTWDSTDIGGTYTETPLTFGGNLNTGSFQWDQTFWSVGDGGLTGLIGVAEIDSSPSFLSLGTYNTDYETNGLYNGALWGVDILDSSPDNGALLGITGGIVLNNSLEGRLLSIYVKPAEIEGQYETGYTYSDNIIGSLYPGIAMFELVGGVTTISMGTTSISPTELYWGSESLYTSMELGNITGDLEGSINIKNLGLLQVDDNVQPRGMGIWWGNSISYYTEVNPPIPSSWTANAEGETYGLAFMEEGSYLDIVGYWGSQITGNRIDIGNKIVGTSAGYIADISTIPFTAISAGETIGTFNPNDYTWQAISAGVWIETNKFLEMTQSSEGIAKLQKLNIPCVEVGRTNLSGAMLAGADYVSVSMNDAIFFAPNSGAKPSIWATNNVSGNYNFSTTPGQIGGIPITDPANSFNISNGGNINATYQFKQWQNNKWLGTVSNGNAPGGIGSYKGSFKFNGAAAGTYSGTNSGSLSGTAAGIAK